MNAMANVGPVVSATIRVLLMAGSIASTCWTLAQTNVLAKSGPGPTAKASDATAQTNSVVLTVETVVAEGVPPLRQRMYAEVSHGRDLFSLSIPDGYTTVDGPLERTILDQAAKEPAAKLIGDGSGPPAAQVAFGDVLRNIGPAETLT